LYWLYIAEGLTYFQDGDQLIQIKTEEVTYIEEEDPLAMTFPAMEAEQVVSCISVCPAFTDIQLFVICYLLPVDIDWFCGRLAPMHLGLMLQVLCAPLLVPSVNSRGAPRHTGVRDLY
jgi:hypothetical protein